MKKLLIAMICLLVASCSNEINVGSNTDVNVKAVVVNINQNEDAIVRQGKYNKPSLCNTVLFRNTSNFLYFTFTSCGNCIDVSRICRHCQGGRCHEVNLNDAWVYGHSIGDTVNFTYVHRERYFVIKNK